MRRTLLTVLVAALLGVAGPIATANADTTSKILSDCTDGTIDGSYTKSQLQQALTKLSSDAGADDYSSCNDVIAQALASGGTQKKTTNSGSSGSSTGSTGSTGAAATPTTSPGLSAEAQARQAAPAELQSAAQEAAKEAAAPPAKVDVDLSNVRVPASALDLGASGAKVPTPLIVALVAFVLAAAGTGAVGVRQVVRRRRGH